MFQDFDWRECVAGRWRDEEHITMLEGRTGLISVRRTCRSLLNRGKRHLKIGDNLGMILVFAKGRAELRPADALQEKCRVHRCYGHDHSMAVDSFRDQCR
eukprot:6421822-Pyramimonas_sp.AAC.1